MNWVRVFNRLFEIINTEGETYFSSGKYISKVREIDPYFPSYKNYIEQRNNDFKSTSKKDYYYDILLSFDEPNRMRLHNSIFDEITIFLPEQVKDIRMELVGLSQLPNPQIATEIWNTERLNHYIQEIDVRINNKNFAGAVTLS